MTLFGEFTIQESCQRRTVPKWGDICQKGLVMALSVVGSGSAGVKVEYRRGRAWDRRKVLFGNL